VSASRCSLRRLALWSSFADGALVGGERVGVGSASEIQRLWRASYAAAPRSFLLSSFIGDIAL
jgi:hypothetical protein